MPPLGFRIRGNFIERNLIGQWQQCKWGNSLARGGPYWPVAVCNGEAHRPVGDLIGRRQQCLVFPFRRHSLGKLFGQWLQFVFNVKHTQIKNNNKAWMRGWGLVALKSVNTFHLLVSPRRAPRHLEYLSGRRYLTPLQLRLVDERSQKTQIRLER